MRYSVAALLALASSALAQTEGFDVISKPTEGDKVPAGETYEITWAPDEKYGEKPVDIILIGGPSQPSQTVIETLATGVPSDAGTFTWEVDGDLGDDKVYGIKIELQEDPEIFQFSFPFTITPDEDDHDGHSSAPASSAPTSTASSTKTKTTSSKYDTSMPTESTTFSSVVSSASSAPESSITSDSSSTPTGTTTTTATTSATTTAATGAATAFAANGFAVLGGLAMAALAL